MNEAYFTHSDYQKAVERVLTHYGFNVWLEYWIFTDGEVGRLDVYGRCVRSEVCDDTTLAVEISRSSRLEKDINRVYKSKAKYGFVLAIKPVEIPPMIWKNVFIVRNLSEFENKLREVLKVSEDYPRITPIIIEEVPLPTYRSLDEVFEKFNIPIDLRERAKKMLLHAYTTCYDLYRDNENWRPGMPIELKYYVVGDENAYNILRQLGIAGLRRDPGSSTYSVYVDERIAKIEAEKYVDEVEEELKKLIDECGWETALIVVALQGKEWLGREDKPLLIELPPELSSIPLEQKELLSRMVISIGALRPILREKYQMLWRSLKKLGLAFECRGSLTLLPEARKVILKLISDKVVEFAKNDKLIRDLASLNILYNCFPLGVDENRIKWLLETLGKLGLKLEDLERVSQALYMRGLISRFIEDQPPYIIVYDEEKFKETVIEKIKSLYSQLHP